MAGLFCVCTYNELPIFAIMTKEQVQDLRDRTTSLRRHL